MKSWTVIIIHMVTSFTAIFTAIGLNRRQENKQDKYLYFALMIGGFIWSQLQTEYLIWRIKKDTKKTVGNS